MPFNLFHRKKQPEQETPAPATIPPEEPAQPQVTEEIPDGRVQAFLNGINDEKSSDSQETDSASVIDNQPQEPPLPAPEPQPQEQPTQEQTAAPAIEETPPIQAEPASKTYLKAMPLKELSDIEKVKADVTSGNIIILRITPLASKSIEDVKTAVNDLFQFAEATGGDIARLGEERVVICPKSIRIWREKTPAPVPSNQTMSTAA